MNQPETPSFRFFCDKLNAAMKLCDISNIQLSRLVNVDPSLISRFRNGHRLPKSNPELIKAISRILVSRSYARKQEQKLAALIGLKNEPSTDESGHTADESGHSADESGHLMDESGHSVDESGHLMDESDLLAQVQAWLSDFDNENNGTIHDLLQTVENLPAEILPDTAPAIDDLDFMKKISDDSSAVYIGDEGLQKAVLRFLSEALSASAPELFLYSDSDMSWMLKPEFQKKWQALMAACVRQSIKIRIIHNINRSLPEMTAAITSWLPLYMSGMIEPYYNNRKNGDRFSHTLFLCPGTACISSFAPADMKDSVLYEYYTDSLRLNAVEQYFTKMLAESHYLVRTKKEDLPDLHENHSVSIQINPSSVTVTRLSRPAISFTFYHPLMYAAFQDYCDEKNSK